MKDNRFYVYVYIDPRSLQEFYFGKGQGNRIEEHMHEDNDSEKSKIIKAIKKEGREPIRKIIARDLTEEQALLIEKTLIWKLGRTLSNVSSGHYGANFRPHNTLHKELYGFDFENGVYCINLGVDKTNFRSWEDSYKYNFITAGQDWKKWGSRICSLKQGDILCAYYSGYGYVGVARVIDKAIEAFDFKYEGKLLSTYPLKCKRIFERKDNPKDGEFILRVEWLSTRNKMDRIGGKLPYWRPISMLASMEAQTKTLALLEKEFKVRFKDLLNNEKIQKAG